MSASLVGSEMCIRDRERTVRPSGVAQAAAFVQLGAGSKSDCIHRVKQGSGCSDLPVRSKCTDPRLFRGHLRAAPNV
eukprot:14118744-Alexandrium_andersonii.AAC.1